MPAPLGATEGSSRDRIAPAGVAPPIFCACARLADFRIDFGGTAAGHYIAWSRACKAAHGELRLCTLEEMEQAIRRGSRGRKPTKAVMFDEAKEPAERRRRKTANQ